MNKPRTISALCCNCFTVAHTYTLNCEDGSELHMNLSPLDLLCRCKGCQRMLANTGVRVTVKL